MLLTRERLYIHIPAFRLLECLDEFFSLNLNCEIYIDSKFIDYCREKDIELLNASFAKGGLSKRVHGPFSDLNPGSSDKKIREISLQRFLQALRLSSRLEAEALILHSHFEPIFYARHFEEWLANSKEVWQELSRQAEKEAIPVYIENSIDPSPQAVMAILKNHPYPRACFDVAHYNVFNPRGWLQAIREYPSGSIKEVHLSDNRGDQDSHLPLGDGNINFEELFNEIERRNEDPAFTIELHSRDDLATSLKFINKFF